MVTPISEIIFSGFVSKVINDVVDVSKDKIRKAVKNKNIEHQNIESQIYNVIVDVLNKITRNHYKDNQNKIYDASEVLLKLFKGNTVGELNIDSYLRDFGLNIDRNESLNFKISLYEELGRNEYGELFRAVLLILLDQKSSYDNAVYLQLNRKLDEVILMLNKNTNNKENNNINKKVESRAQEYADKWEANMFLNDFDKWDENAGVNVKLSDVYIEDNLPHFIWGNNKRTSYNLKDLLSNHINKGNDNMMLLILGQPGIGKSTLITWITAKFSERIDDILVYRFASDLGSVDWKNGRKSNRVLEELGLKHSDLNGKILIIDGFDEISIEPNRRRDILDSLYGDWIYNKTIDNFSLIITCRENYVPKFAELKCKYITLQPWDEIQIKSFCNIFEEKIKNSISESMIERLCKNKEILGIPLILYMVLALNISIKQEGSIVDIYDKIFSLDGGIYDRCIDNKYFADKHRIGEVKKQIHQISREIAIWMFENNSQKESVPKEEYKKICNNVMQRQQKHNGNIKQDFLIGNFFKLVKHCEGIDSTELYFVHRSIYEYFVAETIYSSIENAIVNLTEESQEEFAGSIAVYLRQGEIDYTIGEYLKYKILKLYNKLSAEKQGQFYHWWENSIEKMMKMGMFYYTKKITNFKNIFSKETKCFSNLIEILRLIFDTSGKHYIFEDVDSVLFMRYIKHSLVECRILYLDDMEIDNTEQGCEGYVLELNKLNFANECLEMYDLSEVDLGQANLKCSTLRQANLKRANLREADLRGANLRGADLSRTDLRGADLSGADLSKANLSWANLRGAVLREADLYDVNLCVAALREADLYDANLRGAVLREADLSEVDLSEVDLREVDLKGAKLEGSLFSENQIDNLEKKYNLQGVFVKIEETGEYVDYEKYCDEYR